ncbi:MAG: hypothetical protein IJ220_06785 [Clostridia bacterium]|nr:hypothetical protein [Clostridia bacterium]
MKKVFVLFLILILVLSLGSICLADTKEVNVILNREIKVTYNDAIQEFQNVNGVKVYPLSYEGTTYLPIRSISSLFQSKIKWDGNTNSIYLGEGDLDTTSSKIVSSFTKGNNETIKALLNRDIKIYYNNKVQTFIDATGKAVYPLSYNGTTYLPVRAVSNLFGLKIDWDGVTNTIKIGKEKEQHDSKAAVVYFSATGTTKQVAEYVKDETNADIFEIIPKEKYTSEDLNWNNNDSRTTKEQNDKNVRPEIENNIDISNYDLIFIGYPIWWGDCPRIVQSFIETGKLNGKTAIPFCTSGSSSISGSENTLKNYKEINWISGKRLTASRNDVANWVKSLNIKSTSESKENNNLNTKIIKIEVNNKELTVELENNQAAKELVQKLNSENVVVKALEYGGFEKVGSLGFSLTRDDEQIKTEVGDIVLYQGNQISLFYNSNSWSYTKLGKVTNCTASELKELLGNGDVTLILKK